MVQKATIFLSLWVLVFVSQAFAAAGDGYSYGDIPDEISLVVRDDELLAFSAVAGRWIKESIGAGETISAYAAGGRVAVVYTNRRVLGFSALVNRWVEESLRISETLVSLEAEGNTGTVITNVRALGFSARTGRWSERRFRIE